MGLPCVEPQGAFYAFPQIGSTGMNDETFAERLLMEERVAVIPGSAFGEAGARPRPHLLRRRATSCSRRRWSGCGSFVARNRAGVTEALSRDKQKRPHCCGLSGGRRTQRRRRRWLVAVAAVLAISLRPVQRDCGTPRSQSPSSAEFGNSSRSRSLCSGRCSFRRSGSRSPSGARIPPRLGSRRLVSVSTGMLASPSLPHGLTTSTWIRGLWCTILALYFVPCQAKERFDGII